MAEAALKILPERNDDRLSGALRWLTRELIRLKVSDESGYGLGGEFGYGVTFENDVFLMHRYCWCDSADCPWCSWTSEEGAHFQERFREKGAIPEHRGGAPNFWHKPSGYRVWWYKWIGRDNETAGTCSGLKAMMRECRSSVADH